MDNFDEILSRLSVNELKELEKQIIKLLASFNNKS